jgi:glycosyltransferase involved in cell wall biosynthesis
MRIAQVAPLAESVPPTLYGGTERVVSWLTEELVRRGHQVTLFASGDSRTRAELAPVVPRALRLDPHIRDAQPYNCLLVDRVYERALEFDVIHFHIELLHYPLFRALADRMVTTLHGRLDLPDLHLFYRAFPDLPLISISNAQRKPMPPVNWIATVHHGMPRDTNRLLPCGKRDYLVFLGRICREKGIEDAIAIAERAGITLKIGAKVDASDREYYEERVRPLIGASRRVEFLGEIDDCQKNELLSGARAMLFPICWPEPFGLVMIESMACGTPVIAYRCGSVPEILEDGLTGFVVDNIDGAVASLERLDTLDRRQIRHRFEQCFTVERMTSRYLDVYNRLLESRLDATEAA